MPFSITKTLKTIFSSLLQTPEKITVLFIGAISLLLPATIQAQSPEILDIFNRHSVIMLLIEPESGRIVNANSAAEDFYGYSQEELQNMEIQQINAFSTEEVAAERKLAAAEDRNYFIFRHRLANNEIRTVEVYSLPYVFDGRPLLLSIIFDISAQRELQQDIWHYQTRLEEMVDRQTEDLQRRSKRTIVILSGSSILLALFALLLLFDSRKRKKAEMELRESRAKYQRLVDGLNEHLLFIQEPGGRFTYISPSVEKVLGYPQNEFLKHYNETLTDNPINLKAIEHSQKSLKGIQQPPYEIETYHANEGRRILEVTEHPVFDENGKVISVEGIAHDVTDKKRILNELELSQRTLATVLDSMDLAAYIADMKTYELIFLNQAGKQQIAEQQDIREGTRCWEIIQGGQNGPCSFCSNSKLIDANGQPTGIYIWEFQNTRNGRWYECRDRAIYWHDNRLVRLETATDITERKEMEANLRRSRVEAEKANKAKSEFLANMSHEIRTPMNAIIGVTDILSEADIPEKYHEHIEVLNNSSETLLELINDILDLSRIEAGNLDIVEVDFSLKDLVKSQVTMLQPAARQKGVNLDYTIEKSVPEIIHGDRRRIRQVIMNLTGNAVKFTHDGFVHVSVHDEKTSDGPILIIKVKDTGIGIKPEDLKKIFTPFVQLDSSATRRYSGTGLGLGICQAISESLDGEINVESEEGKGTTFTFTLPLKEASHTSSHSNNESIKYTEQTGDGNPRSLRILLAEDSDDNIMLLEHYLEETDHSMIVTHDGREALETYMNDPDFDLILMDIQMPVMDGYEATRKIRRHEKENDLQHIPIIALTAHALSGDNERSLDAGCDGHQTKPIRKKEFLKLIENISLQNPVRK